MLIQQANELPRICASTRKFHDISWLRSCRLTFIPRTVRNGVFDPQPKAQAFALMASNLQTPAPSATGQTRPNFRPRDVSLKRLKRHTK